MASPAARNGSSGATKFDVENAAHSPSDERLIEATLAGDDGAFALLVTRYKRRVFSIAVRFSRDDDELEDICQEVFIKAYENLGSFRHDAPFEHWLSRIAVRACHDMLRSKRHAYKHSSLDDLTFEIRDSGEEARQAARQAREVLAWAMDRLKPEERLVITLLELEEYRVSEIAQMTGWSTANVKVRAHRARLALKRILEKNHEH
ncbi:MAG TPA: sigma-70 family RNA polymerase sigma factor [Desulfuromonadaceae bacterium]